MGDWRLHFYHRLPAVMKNTIATIRGYQLRRWRYGPETEQLVEAALERDRWTPEQWEEYQNTRLEEVLHRAATRVPYYREMWAQRRRKGDKAAWDLLENWPILRKAPLRENPLQFVADDCEPRAMYVDNTSGTTGTPLKLYVGRATMRHWYALSEARWRRWYGVSVNENWAILGGQPIVAATASRPPFWVWNAASHQLYLSANHISGANAEAFLSALRQYRVTHLISYTSSATYWAQLIIAQGLQNNLPDLRTIVTNAEPLYDWQRDLLATAFDCPIHETYGLGEFVAAASADEQRRLRLWPEPGYLEILNDADDMRVPLGETGRMVATSLLNIDMPLIRYETGDRSGYGTAKPTLDDPRQHPILLPIQGRNNDMLIAPDGRRVYWINPIFYGLPIAEAQVHQYTLGSITVRYVPANGFIQGTRRTIEQRLHSKLGAVTVEFEELTSIPRGPNGKFRAVVSNVTDDFLKQDKR